MSEARILEVYFEGDRGHQGNVLANDFVARFQKLVAVLARMERINTGGSRRKTDYEIVDADKYNPTLHKLKAVPKVSDYSPAAAFDWTLDQFDAVANDKPLDRRLDAATLKELSDLAAPAQAGGQTKFWLQTEAKVIRLDEVFRQRANAAFLRAKAEETPVTWYTGVTYGEVTGSLQAVYDLEGEQEFIIKPAAGPSQIVCKFPEEKREEMRQCLFKVATIEGRLHYNEDSPHPYLVEMVKITARPPLRRHLLDMRGVFGNSEMPRGAGIDL